MKKVDIENQSSDVHSEIENQMVELYTELGAIEYNILIHTTSLERLTSLKQDIVNKLQALTQPS